jgi:hypothetical protein
MSIGYPITKVDLDNRMGGMVVNLRNAFNDVVLFKALLDDATILPDATLVSLGYSGSVSSGEIKQIRDSFTTMSLLNTVSRGGSTVGSLVDFWFDAKHLAGLNFH